MKCPRDNNIASGNALKIPMKATRSVLFVLRVIDYHRAAINPPLGTDIVKACEYNAKNVGQVYDKTRLDAR